MNILKKIHQGWIEMEQLGVGLQVVGKYQYIYSSNKGEISLISLPNYFGDKIELWEICSHGKLFEDVMRFDSKEKAEQRIKELLD